MDGGMGDYFIADDLSGALDAAAAFHAAGRRVRIAVTPEGRRDVRAGEVLALTTETRNAPADVAAGEVRRVLADAQGAGGRLLYKKIDSTLRGAVRAELAAVLELLPDASVLFAPANPRVGRTVRDGVLLVHGVPVADTEFGRDPASPLKTSRIRELLGDVAEQRVVIPDVCTDADLARAVAEMNATGQPWVAVGSGGLIAVIAGCPASSAVPPPTFAGLPRGVLMVGGSAHPANRTQSDRAAADAGVTVREVDVADWRTGAVAVGGDIAACGVGIVRLPSPRVERLAALRAITVAAEHVIEGHAVRRVFATGGETAFALCERLAIRSLRYLEEIEAGLALSVGESRIGPVLLAVKPGGFGDQDTWIRAAQRLRAL